MVRKKLQPSVIFLFKIIEIKKNKMFIKVSSLNWLEFNQKIIKILSIEYETFLKWFIVWWVSYVSVPKNLFYTVYE